MSGLIAYLRKSLDEKGKQIYSIEVQRSTIKEAAERYNKQIKKFTAPEKLSGGCRNRPIFLAMLEEVKNGKYDGIAAYTVDRLTRNLTDADRILDLIIERDVDLFIATMPGMDWKTPEGVIVFVQFASWGVVERLMTKMRTLRVHKHLKKEGRHLGQIPYGYKKIWTSRKKKEYRIEVVEEEAEIIRRVYLMATELGMGRRKIATALGLEEGHVRSILENERYTGYMVVDGEVVETELPPIIPVEVFCRLHPSHDLCRYAGEIAAEGKTLQGKNRE